MNKLIEIKKAYNSLDKLENFLTKQTNYLCLIDYDIWEIRTDIYGEMEKCLILQKSTMHALKLYFINENTVKATYIIPNKVLNAYFGKSEKMHRNIIEIIASAIKQVLLISSQQNAFEDLENVVRRAAI